MQQLHMQNHNNISETAINNNATTATTKGGDSSDTGGGGLGAAQTNPEDLNKDLAKLSLTDQQLNEQHHEENQQLQSHQSDDDDYVLIQPAKIWTRPDIEEFKVEVSAGDGDGVITIGHGDTVTV